jgi:xyloglucan-specific exo-beta-1,4-glucanase
MLKRFLLVGMALVGPGPLTAGMPYSFRPVQVYGGGYITGMVFHPTVQGLAYARTDMGGAYKWNAGSASWTPLTDFLSRDQADYMGNLALALDRNDANRVYLLCGKYTQSWAGNGAVLRSSDQGATWAITALPFKVGGNEEGRGAGERLAVDPNLGSILLVGSNASGLYRSTNYGVNWTAVGGFPGVNPTFILFDRASGTLGNATQTIYVGVAATSNSLYRSTDGGTSWALVPGQPTGNIPLRAAFGNGGRLYITYGNVLPNNATGGAMWRLDTGAGTWTNLNPPTGQGGWCAVSVLPGANDQVAIASGRGLHQRQQWRGMDRQAHHGHAR